MADEKYVALYARGGILCGAIKESAFKLMCQDWEGFATHYITRPVSSDRAREITGEIIRCSEGVEKLLAEER